MADEQVEFELVTPEQLLLSRGVEMVVVPGAEGDFGVLPRHTPDDLQRAPRGDPGLRGR